AQEPAMAPPTTEMMGATAAPLALGPAPVETDVSLDAAVAAKTRRSFAPDAIAASTTGEPDRIYLNLENIRGFNDAATFYVYVNLPQGADPAAHPECLAGPISLFGVRKASAPDGEQAGNGVSEVLDITRIVDALHLSGAALDHLKVTFTPGPHVKAGDRITVGRVSVYREGE
ncbi:MAG: hypothetical protein ACHP84_19025, partial [Caulobacterales bacterium]